MGWNDFPWPTSSLLLLLINLPAHRCALGAVQHHQRRDQFGQHPEVGRMGIKTLLTYVTTTMAAVVIGLALVNVFQPGWGRRRPAQANRIPYELWRDANGSKHWMIFEPSINSGECGAGQTSRARSRFE